MFIACLCVALLDCSVRYGVETGLLSIHPTHTQHHDIRINFYSHGQAAFAFSLGLPVCIGLYLSRDRVR